MALTLGYFCAGVLLAGFSEVFSPLFSMVLFALWVRSRERKHIAALLGILVGLLIVLIAPGNAIRAATLPPHMPILNALQQTFKVSGLFLIGQILDHPGALLLAFCIGYLCPLKIRIRRKLLWTEALALVSFAVIGFTLFVPLFLANGLTERHFSYASLVIVLYVGTIGALCGSTPRSLP